MRSILQEVSDVNIQHQAKDYDVIASMGHIRNLANTGKYGLGIDIDADFKPTYENVKSKSKVITNLKNHVKEERF